jgi:hypothetical protein
MGGILNIWYEGRINPKNTYHNSISKRGLAAKKMDNWGSTVSNPGSPAVERASESLSHCVIPVDLISSLLFQFLLNLSIHMSPNMQIWKRLEPACLALGLSSEELLVGSVQLSWFLVTARSFMHPRAETYKYGKSAMPRQRYVSKYDI